MYGLTINARLQPIHRGEIYEDPICDRLEEMGIGGWNGAGSVLGEDGEIRACDVALYLRPDNEVTLQKLLDLLDTFDLPKGSKLMHGGDVICELGNMEGLAVYLNGTELPAEVYASSDINVVISEMETYLGEAGKMYSWYEGSGETALYFYGKSFEEMKSQIESVLTKYPFCRKCRVVQIA